MNVETETKNIVATIFKTEPKDLNRNTRFVEDLFIKSTQVVELVALTGHVFGVQIPLKDARKSKTVGQLIDYITARQAARAA